MPRLIRIALVTALVAALAPTTLLNTANAHHEPGGACQSASSKVQGYIPVAAGTPDQTTLHYQVLLPNKELFGEGPFPAVMDYSGYQPGITIYDGLHRHFLCQGYAVIGLNIRGTGCSGGRFDYFEPRQAEDGREAIQWFADNAGNLGLDGKIAMVGKSYPGITQLFVTGQPGPDNPLTPAHDESQDPVVTPENLVAIVPGAVFSDLYRDVPFPGGIMNITFAAGWSAGRIYEPFTAPFQEHGAIQNGDQQCTTNAAEHVQNPPFNPFVKATYNQFDGDLFHERSPWYFADNITVPTFLFETWQDEQVGSRATQLVERFDENLEWRFLGTNGDHGGHGDYYGSHVMPKIDEFLSFYLKGEVPAAYQGGTVTTTREVACPTPTPTPTPLPTKTKKPKGKPSPQPTASPTPTPSPTTCTETETRPETFAEALARYESGDPVQINWENGAGGGDRTPSWIQTYPEWPPPAVQPLELRFTGEGEMVRPEDPAPTADALTYNYKPGSSQQRGGYKITSQAPTIDGASPASWNERPEDGTYLMFETATLESDHLMAGTASADLWLSSTAPDTDLQVTLTEVRADGKEVFVQQGWLRASHRALDESLSTPLRPFQTHLATDARPLVPTQPEKMRVEIFPFAHPFRAGSTIRLYVEAPHVKPDLWGFALLPTPAQNTIHVGGDKASALVLPHIVGATVPDSAPEFPACSIWGHQDRKQGPIADSDMRPVLRNQPCRDAE